MCFSFDITMGIQLLESLTKMIGTFLILKFGNTVDRISCITAFFQPASTSTYHIVAVGARINLLCYLKRCIL